MMLAAQMTVPHYAFANPEGGTVTDGTAHIAGEGTNHLTITQSSERAFIEWDSFSVGASERVDFVQPSAHAVTANKVIGTDPSSILGQVNATGKLLIINGNGVVFGENSVIDAASLIATTHNISAEDIMSGSDPLDFSGGTASIINNGNIAIRDGGFAALLAPQIVNNGTITARLGTVALAASQSVSVDFYGDGLLQFTADSALQSVSDDMAPLIDQQGQIIADGGLVTMTTKAASNIITQSVNMGGLVQARSAISQDGRIILSADSAVTIESDATIDATGGGAIELNAQSLALGGLIDASATDGDGGSITLSVTDRANLSGTIDARSTAGSGGLITLTAGSITENSASTITASGTSQGGDITVRAETNMMSSGSYDASASSGAGGMIDITARDLRSLSASYDASGTTQGGRIRIGGAFQGGKELDMSQDYIDSFVTRWPDHSALTNAAKSFLNDGTHINVSASDGAGGTAIIWSDVETTFLGSISATGSSGGSVEISSAATLRYASLTNIAIGDGTLLLDPKNITIGNSAEVQSWSYQGLIGRWYRPDVDVSLDSDDEFGAALALSDDNRLLAVGAPGDDGSDGSVANAGAVYLFTFTNSDFAGGAMAGVIGDGYQSGSNVNVSSLDTGDNFGTSVALDSDGNRLAVGATGDDASGGGVSNAGAVYLFTFTDTSFGGGAHDSTLGSGYSDLDVTLDSSDVFGSAVALNASGQRLVVGAPGADGDGNALDGSGALYMMSFSDTSFSSPSVVGIIGTGYKGSNDLHLANLGSGDMFGSSVASSINHSRIAVGAPNDSGFNNSGSSGAGAVYLFSFENEMYKTPTLAATLGEGYKGESDQDITLDAGDAFGASVAFSTNGLSLAVGAPNDDGQNLSGSANYGAVHLIAYSSSDLTGTPSFTTIGNGYTGSGDLNLSTLSTSDEFGSAVALNGNGNRLAVGATGGDGDGGSSNSGDITLLSFASTNFSTPAISGLLGEGYDGNDYENNANLDANEQFGVSVSLNNDGTRMAVGSVSDGGSPDTSTSYGSVSLYSFTDTNYSNAVLEGTIGYGYAGTKDVNFSSAGDLFGQSVSLNGAGNRLAVGQSNEDSKGVVRLFSFTDNDFSSGTLTATIGDGYVGTNDISVTLDTQDRFGAGVSLSDDATLLAVGAPNDDGTAGSNTGAVYLYRFTDSNFAGGTASGVMGSGYTNTGDVNVTLASDDSFGASVSLDSDGNRLAVGATGDTGPDGNQGAGAVLLFTFGDTTFVNGTLVGTIGDGYTATDSVDVTNIGKLDAFGTSVSLNGTGDRLAVGAPGDDTSTGDDTGAVYLFQFDDADFGDGALTQMFGAGYSSTNQFDVTSLDAGDRFGSSVALNDIGDRLVVGAINDDGGYDGETNVGVVHLFNASHSSGGYYADGQTYANLGSDTITVNAYEVADILARGTNLSLQASSDITVSNAVQVGGFAQNAGDITLRAGRSIVVNESIITNGGDISLFANDTAANGVVEAQRDTGAAGITLASAKSLNAGSGDVSLIISDASDRTNNTSGDISILANATISGNVVTIRNDGPTSNSDVIVGSGGQISASASGDAIIVVADAFSNSAGASVLNPLAGRYQLWTNDDTGYDVTVLAPDFIQYGAIYGSTSIAGASTEDGVFYTDTATVTADFRSVTTKTYDGGTSVTVADSDIGVTGANSNETVVLSASTAAFDNANVGSGKMVTLTGLSVASASRGSIDIYGYGVSSTTASNTNGVITAKAISLTGHSATDKTYDGTNSASVSYGSLSGVVDGDTVSLDTSSATSRFSDANVGTGKTVTFSGLGLSGDDATNYTIATQTSTANITHATLTLASATADDKIYDGDAAANISAYGSLSGIFNSDAVSLDPSSVSASFDSANVGTGKTVTLSGLAITGADSTNYTISASTTTTADITAKALTITSAAAADKTYDATDTASVTAGTLSGFIGSETVTATASGQFADANVGTGKNVSVTYSLADGTNGGLASNYSLSSETVTADITAKALTITSASAADKTYDATDTASVTAGTLSGFVGSETVTATASGQFADVNVGTGKNVSVTYSLADGTNGGLASNYSLSGETVTADITAKALTITSASATDKTYDATNSISVTAGTLSGFIGSETVTASASGTTSDANAGTGKYVTVTYSLADGTNGGLASNYSLANSAASVDITPKALSYSSITAADKIYDGSTSANVTTSGLSGFIGSETVTALSDANFADANVGTAKNITISFALANGTNGGLASNYSLATETRTADITAKALSISGTSVADKTYDATTNATMTAGTLSGLIGSETLGLSANGSFADSAVGSGKSVAVTYSLADGTNNGIASNYSIADETLTAAISARALQITGLNIATKIYDGTTSATITSIGSLDDIQGSDDVTIDSSGASAIFTSANAGTRAVNLSGISLSGSSASNYTLTLPSATGVISKKALSITGSQAANKPYDGTRNATITTGILSGFIGTQTLDVDGTGLFATAAPGFDKSVAVTYYLKDGNNGGFATNYTLQGEVLLADIEGKTKEKQDILAPMVEQQVEIVKNDIKIEREEKLEMIETVEQKVIQETQEPTAYVETVGSWVMLSCEASGEQQGMCSVR